jgi:hypothetical protein
VVASPVPQPTNPTSPRDRTAPPTIITTRTRTAGTTAGIGGTTTTTTMAAGTDGITTTAGTPITVPSVALTLDGMVQAMVLVLVQVLVPIMAATKAVMLPPLALPTTLTVMKLLFAWSLFMNRILSHTSLLSLNGKSQHHIFYKYISTSL